MVSFFSTPLKTKNLVTFCAFVNMNCFVVFKDEGSYLVFLRSHVHVWKVRSFNWLFQPPFRSFAHFKMRDGTFFFFRKVNHLLARTPSRNRINLLVMCTRPSWLLGLNLVLRTSKSYLRSFRQNFLNLWQYWTEFFSHSISHLHQAHVIIDFM